MKRVAMIVAFLAVFVMYFGPPSAFAQATVNRFHEGWTPWSWVALNKCINEEVTINGMSRIQGISMNNAGGGTSGAYSQSLRGTGIASPSGNGYEFSQTEAGQYYFRGDPFTGMSTFGATQVIRLISVDKDVPDLWFHLNYRFVTDPSGIIRAEVENLFEECR